MPHNVPKKVKRISRVQVISKFIQNKINHEQQVYCSNKTGRRLVAWLD